MLVSRLPSGQLSAALPWLTTSGHRIVTVDGDALTLRGINLPDLGDPAASLDTPLDWPLNVARLRVPAPIPVQLDVLDALIARHADRGAYTLLLVDAPATASDGADEPADSVDVTLLLALAARYANEPAVLFELAPDAQAETTDSSADLLWQRAARRWRSLLAPLRALHPRAFVFAAGLNRGHDLSGFPLRSGDASIPNLVYSAALHPGALAQLGAFARRQPLFVANWQADASAGLLNEATLGVLAAAGIGWAASDADSRSGWLRNARGVLEPTPSGRWVQRALAISTMWDAAR